VRSLVVAWAPGVLWIVVLLLVVAPVSAQDDGGASTSTPQYVFLERGIDNTGLNHLIFVDTLTGEETDLEVYGQRFALYDRNVMYFDPVNQRVMLASPDGRTREHPFIQPEPDTRRVDWAIDRTATKIAWTLTNADAQNQLSTITTVANIDGTEPQQILVDGPSANGIRALPVAFSPDLTKLYMDAHPDGIDQFTAFNQYVSIFEVDIESGEIQSLPEEDGRCICGAGLGSNIFLRLRRPENLEGYDVHIYDLSAGFDTVLPALQLNNYSVGGGVLIAPDGTRAVYALARVSDFGTPQQSIQTVFVLVDLLSMTQEALTRPITTFVRPAAWTEDNSAIIFTSPTQDGTWKISVGEGRLERIATATYLGILGQ
jgi:hypothetical protein